MQLAYLSDPQLKLGLGLARFRQRSQGTSYKMIGFRIVKWNWKLLTFVVLSAVNSMSIQNSTPVSRMRCR